MLKAPPKITWLTQGWPSDTMPMAGVFHKGQVLALNNMNIDINVITPVPWVPPLLSVFKSKWRNLGRLATESYDNGIQISRPRYLAIPRENHLFINHFSIYNQVKPLIQIKKPDIIHAHFAYSTGVVAAMLKKNLGIPYILTLHGDDVTEYPHRSKRGLSLFKFALANADKVFAVSPSLAEKSKTLYDREIEIIPNGLNKKWMVQPQPKEEIRKKLGLDNKRLVILFVGNLTIEKGIPVLREALKSIDQNQILPVFIGDGPEKVKLQSELSNCMTLGVLPHDQIAYWMQASDILVLPSLHEGLGQVVVEAGFIGLPVIGSNTGGISDLLKENRGTLIEPNNIYQLTQAIEKTIKSYSTALKKAENLREFVNKHHDINVVSRKTFAAYTQLIDLRK
ncbi:MAG: glycosyltransferase [Alphaproteobacteria bacterium]|nr:glycosyltransferase [Alphaproteobacteria bacterium]